MLLGPIGDAIPPTIKRPALTRGSPEPDARRTAVRTNADDTSAGRNMCDSCKRMEPLK